LGRGLSSLIREATAAPADTSGAGERMATLPVEKLQPGKYQPRSHMDPERLEELAESIRAQGLIQPIIVRGIGGGRY
ncbi:chromosome partitioning protein ParB, partial [Citrobacter sp. AAK_AS5]